MTHKMQFQFVPLIAAVMALTPAALAYNNNCDGSIIGLAAYAGKVNDSINSIVPTNSYSDGAHFGSSPVHAVYATNGNGDQPVQGSVLITAFNELKTHCGFYDDSNNGGQGSWGTGNCDACHVTLDLT